MNRKELLEEQRRFNRYRKQGKSEQWLKSWLRGWRVGREEDMKRCSCCGIEKPLDQFYQLQTACKTCRVDKQRNHRAVRAREHLWRSELLEKWRRA